MDVTAVPQLSQVSMGPGEWFQLFQELFQLSCVRGELVLQWMRFSVSKFVLRRLELARESPVENCQLRWREVECQHGASLSGCSNYNHTPIALSYSKLGPQEIIRQERDNMARHLLPR